MFIGLAVFGSLSDKLLTKYAGTGEKKPEYRLPPMIVAGAFIPIGLFIYGWTAEYQVFWFWPIFGTGILGLGLLGIFMCIQTYLIDAYTIHAASAVAANTILRSLAGALLPLAGPPLYQNLGLGWGNSLLGFISVAMLPVPWLFAKYGESIRKNPRFQPKL
jgi:MFS family permease